MPVRLVHALYGCVYLESSHIQTGSTNPNVLAVHEIWANHWLEPLRRTILAVYSLCAPGKEILDALGLFLENY